MRLYANKEKKNKGFSLVELVVVMAIMAIMAGAVTIALSPGKDAKECMQKLEASLNKGRLDSMSKRNYSFKVTRDDNGIYLETYDNSSGTPSLVTSEKVGKAGVTVGYVTSSGDPATPVTLNNGDGISLAYDRASGAFLESVDITYLTFSRGNRTYVLRLYKETGKIEEQ